MKVALFVILCSWWAAGCAIKAPLVTDTLPITQVKAMSRASSPSSVKKTTPTPMATPVATPNPLPQVTPPPVSAEETAAEIGSDGPATDDAGTLATPPSSRAAMTGTQTYYLAGGQSLPPLAKALQIETMTFRSLLATPDDQSSDSLKNDALTDQCPSGRANLDFIHSVAVGVKHQGEKDTQAVLVASYQQVKQGLCGFHLTPTYFDMKEYAGDYVFVIQVTGTLPPANVSLSGFYTVQDYEGI